MTAMSILPEEESELETQEPLKRQPWWRKSPTFERTLSPEYKNRHEENANNSLKDPQKVA